MIRSIHLSAALCKPLLAICFAFTPASQLHASQETYFGSTTPIDVAEALVVDQGATATNLRLFSLVGIGTTPAPENSQPTGNIRLAASFISPTLASPQGYSGLMDDILGPKSGNSRLLGSARKEIQGVGPVGARTPGAAEYRYGDGQNGKEANWDIQFDGVPNFDPSKKNFDESKIREAIRQARLAIRANQFEIGPSSGYAILFEAAYEATIPYTYAGNEWRALAEKERTNIAAVPAPSISGHISRLETAAIRYRKATEPLLALLNHPVESRYLWEPRSFIGTAAAKWGTDESLWSSTWDQLLFESYIEAVTKLAECQFEKLQSRYFLEYRSPDSPTGGFNRTPLLAEIDAASAEIEQLMLPISAAAMNGLIEGKFDTSTPLAHAARIRRLKDNVVEYALAFDIGLNSSDRYSFATYGPNYVPFLIPVQLASRPFTFDNFRALVFGIVADQNGDIIQNRATPNSLIGISIDEDARAAAAEVDRIKNTDELDLLKFNTRKEYQGQLAQLCGQRLSDPNNIFSTPIPDLLGYFAPTEDREPLRSNETYGDIALQWAKIDQAETRLLSAYRAFDEIFEEAEIIQEYGEERLLSYGRIANIQLDSGEQISALDYLSGEIRAKAIEQAAEERAKQAEKKSFFGAIGKWAVRGIAAVVTGGTSLAYELAYKALADPGAIAADLGGAIDQHRQAKSQAEMHRNIGRIEADAARRQAEIQAQMTQIRAMEAAKITLEQRGQEDNRIREGIHKLMIRVERQKLEILLAKQQLEFAELEHSNTLGRIAYLIEEYRRVTIRNAKSTLNRPDVRLRRDYEIREAARSFRVAQEYAWLLARSADYRFGYNQSFRNRIATETQAILHAQNGKQLEAAVSRLIQIRGDFLQATGGMAGVKQVRFSLRDIVAQSNHASAVTARSLNGEWEQGADTALLQPFPSTVGPGGNDPVAISDKQFENYLRANLIADPTAAGSRILRLRFPIGFEPAPVGETLDEFGDPAPTGKENPLRTQITSQFGHLIVGAAPSYDQGQGIGVFINMRNRGALPGGFPTTATLKPIGTFYTTTTNAPSPTGVIQSLRVWNPIQAEGLDFDDDGRIRDAFVDNSIRIIHNADTRPDNTNWRSQFVGLGLESAGSKLHERSPANDHWLLEIKAPNNVWSSYLPNARDIEVCMTIRGW